MPAKHNLLAVILGGGAGKRLFPLTQQRSKPAVPLGGKYRLVDISPTQMIVEASGNKEKVEAFIELLRPVGIHEITRTGRIAIGRLSNIEAVESNDEDGEPNSIGAKVERLGAG